MDEYLRGAVLSVNNVCTTITNGYYGYCTVTWVDFLLRILLCRVVHTIM